MREEPNDRHADSICPLLATHNMEKVAEKWISWVRAESFKRYSEYFFFFFFFFLVRSQIAYVLTFTKTGGAILRL